jgi:hypothetical protein
MTVSQAMLVAWLVGDHLLLLRDFGPYVIKFMMCVLLLPLPCYGDQLLLRDFRLYGIIL